MIPEPHETSLSRQARIAIHIDSADRPTRFAAAFLFVAVLLWYREPVFLAAFALGTISFEAWFEWLRRQAAAADTVISQALAKHHLVLSTFGIIHYTMPALIFSFLPGQANVLCAVFWLSGIAIHITNRYVLLNHYFWTQNLGTFGVFSWALVNIALSPPTPLPPVDWLIAGLCFLVMFANTLESFKQHADTRAELASAQEDAASRMSELEHIMRHDPLTGLLRRTAFDAELEQLMETPRAAATSLALFIIDLDGFKPINDTFGHSAGDHLLKVVGLRLQANATHLAARLGGDEFGVAIDGITNPAEALTQAARIRSELTQPVEWDGKTISVGASVGVNLYNSDCCGLETLCAGADQAMYHAKSTGGDGIALFDKEIFEPRLNLLDRQVFVDAIANGEIEAHYQPKVNLRTRHVVGFEALARWPGPKPGDMKMPGEFLPQIAELKLQSEFVGHMTRKVIGDVASMLGKELDPGQVSINLPEAALATKSGLDDLLWILAERPEVLKHITFEITEDVLIARAGDIIHDSIDRLSQQGVRISLDDFGTGFASFQHLRQLTFDELKIDTSFVAGLGRDTVSDVIVDGFLSIASGLGVDAVAEGVETEEQATHLAVLGCQYGQGFLFGRAMPLSQAEALLSQPLLSTGT